MSRRFQHFLATGLVAAAIAVAVFYAIETRAEGGLTDLDGGPFDERELERGPAIVVVWASWSPRCRDVAQRLDRIERTWAREARVSSLVFQEDPAAVRRFLAATPTRARTLVDRSGAFCRRHAVTDLPGLLVFRDGQAAFRGKLPADPDPVIRRALRGE